MTSSALLIGVPGPVSFVAQGRDYSFGPLSGVLNDIQWFETFLSEQLGPDAEIRTLTTPEETTVRALSDALTSAVAGCADGSLLVIVFSGHGFQLPDQSHDELDHLDEALVASDGPLLDDFFGRLWASNPGRFRVVQFIDSCSADSVGIALHYDDSPQPVVEKVGLWPARIQFAAAMADESAAEFPSGAGTRGLLSWALQSAWGSAANRGSYLDWFRAASVIVRNRGPLQHPRIRYLGPDAVQLSERPFTTAAD